MSIRTRLLLIALVAVLLPALLAGWRFAQEREGNVAQAAQRLRAVADRIAADLAETIKGAEQLHYGLARARDLDTTDRAACSAYLRKVREKFPQYTGILTVDPAGHLFCDSLATGRNLDLNDREYFKAAKLVTDKVVMQPTFGRLTQLPVLQIAYPARDESGALRFVLLASLNLAKLADHNQREPTMPGLEILLFDRGGKTLAGASEYFPEVGHGPLFRIASQRPAGGVAEVDGAVRKVWAVGDSRLIPEAGIHIMVGQPRNDLVAAANQRLAEDLAVLGVSAALLFLGLWFLADRGIRRHLATISEMAKRLGNEQPVATVGPYPKGEFGTLMVVLDETANSLRRQRADIDTLNERLRRSQRLEAVGQLTGGLAHDFNNLLTVVMGNAEALHAELAANPRLAALAGMVLDAATRGSQLTQHLLAFARKQPLDPRSVDVDELVAGFDPLLRHTLGEHIDIKLARGAGLWRALIDPAQLENAVLNLSLNARDAMPGGGQLTIETANANLDADFVAEHGDVEPGSYVVLSVTDTGTGISPENVLRVFEPFYTTKEPGKGTGLGLAMVYGFIKQSGGHVTIDSRPGEGTAVRLYLPRAPETAAPVDPAPAASEVGGDETVLLVEDDELVRSAAVGHLARLGYDVIAASNGAQALEVLRTTRSVDLLFTDVVMPGMSGRHLADEAKRLRPGLKVLFTSGYPEDAIVHQGRLDPGVQLLSKPYRRAALARSIRAALDPT